MIPDSIQKLYENWIIEFGSDDIPIKEKIVIAYQKRIKEALETLKSSTNEDEYYSRLQQLLTDNWAFIQDTSLSYNSRPRSEVTKVLCALAKSLAQYHNQHLNEHERPITALELLMPGLDLELSYPGFSHLSPQKATQWTKEDESQLAALRASYLDVDAAALDTLKESYEQEYNNSGTNEERLRVSKLISYQNQPPIDSNVLQELQKNYEQQYESCTEEERLRFNQLIAYQNQLSMHYKGINPLSEGMVDDINNSFTELKKSLSASEKKLVELNDKIKTMKALELLPQLITELEASLSDSEKNLVAIHNKIKELDTYQLLAKRHTSYQEEQGSGEYTRLNEHSAWLMPTASLERVLEETIVSVDQTTLVPIQVLLGDDPDIRPYGGYRETSQEDLDLERQRLHEHSPETRALADAQARIDQIKNDKRNLLGHLTTLCAHLSMNDAHGGKGVQENAASGAYPAIIAFRDYYTQLDASEKEKIPGRIKKEIDLLLSVAFDASVNVNATANMATCIGTRREDLEKAIKGQETQLAAIASSDEQKAVLLKQTQEQMQLARKSLKDALENHTYSMDTPLPLSKKLLDALKLPLVIKSIEELQDLLRLSPAEFIALTQNDGGNQKLAKLFGTHNIDALVMLFIEQGTKQLDTFLQVTHPHLFNQLKFEDYPLIIAGFLADEKYEIAVKWLLKDAPSRAKALINTASLKKIPFILQCLSKEEQLALIVHDRYTLLHKAKDDPALLKHLFALLPEDQRLDAVKIQNDRVEPLLYEVTNNPELLQSLIELIPQNQKLEALQVRHGNKEPIIHQALQNPETLITILSLLPEEQRLAAVKMKNNYGQPLLNEIANHPELFKSLIELIPESQRIEATQEKDQGLNRNALHLAAKHQNKQSLEMILALYPKEQQMSAVLNQDKSRMSPLCLAASNVELLKMLLAFIPDEQKVNVVKTTPYLLKNATDDESAESLKLILEFYPSDKERLEAIKNEKLMYSALRYPKSLKTLLELYPTNEQRLAAVKEMNSGITLLHSAAYYPGSSTESLQTILDLYPRDQRLEALKVKDSCDQTVLEVAYGYPESLKIIMESLPLNDQEALILDAVNQENDIFLNNLDSQLLVDMLSMLTDDQQTQCLSKLNDLLTLDQKRALVNCINHDMDETAYLDEQAKLDLPPEQLISTIKDKASNNLTDLAMKQLIDAYQMQQFKKLHKEIHELNQEVRELDGHIPEKYKKYHEILSMSAKKLAEIEQIAPLSAITAEQRQSLHAMKSEFRRIRIEIQEDDPGASTRPKNSG